MHRYDIDNGKIIVVRKAEISLENAGIVPIIKGIETKPPQIKDDGVIRISTIHTLVFQIKFIELGGFLFLGKPFHSLDFGSCIRVSTVCRHQLIQREQDECQQEEDKNHVD